jgi:hypothetical protein
LKTSKARVTALHERLSKTRIMNGKRLIFMPYTLSLDYL